MQVFFFPVLHVPEEGILENLKDHGELMSTFFFSFKSSKEMGGKG